MKKYLNQFVFLLATIVALQACTKEYESVFEDSADARVQKELDEFRTTLLDAENGWKGYIFTGTGPGFSFYFNFREDGYVDMVSDFNQTTGKVVKTGTYVMKGLQQPTLSFDTYSYIHLLADPSGSVNGGENGTGLISDFEFYFDGTSGDSLKLMGIKNSIPLTLIKATSDERAKFLNGTVGQIITGTSTLLENNKYPWIQAGSTQLAVEIDSLAKVFSFLYLNQAKTVVTLSSKFTYSVSGIELVTPIALGNATVSEITWDKSAQNYYILLNGQKLYFQQGDEPVIPLVYALGFLHQYVAIDESVPALMNKLPQEFLDIWNATKDGIYNVDTYKLNLTSFFMQFDESNSVDMYYIIQNSTGTYAAVFTYNMSVTNAGIVTFTYQSANANGDVLLEGAAPLLNYFANNTFTMDYVQDPDLGTIAGVYPVAQPNAYFYGLLE